MRVVRLVDSGSGPLPAQDDAPQPRAAPGQVLIRVCAAGVTPTELDWYPTTHNKAGEKRAGAVPGHEFSGVIAAAGEGISGLEVGREVFGMNDWFSDGATAEFCVEPNREQLAEIGGLLEAGRLRAVVDTVVPLSRAPEAYAGKVERHGRGKLVVTVANSN